MRIDFGGILRTLAGYDVQFIVVGGVAAALHGSPVSTFDVDIVHARDAQNVTNLLAALDSLDAYYRLQPQRRLRPLRFHLESPGHQLLMTKIGPLDVLGAIGVRQPLSYEDLAPFSDEVTVGPATTARVLQLEKLIQLKEELGADKDMATLPFLRRLLKQKRG